MSLPYFPMFPADFDADTGHLTLAEDGAYNRLLRLQWRAPGCKLPADMDWIFRKAKAVTEVDQAVLVSIIAEFFTLSLIHISEPTRPCGTSRMPSSA